LSTCLFLFEYNRSNFAWPVPDGSVADDSNGFWFSVESVFFFFLAILSRLMDPVLTLPSGCVFSGFYTVFGRPVLVEGAKVQSLAI